MTTRGRALSAMPTGRHVPAYWHGLPVWSARPPPAEHIARGRRAGCRAPGREGSGLGERWHGTCTLSVQQEESRGKTLHAISSTNRKETTIMAALTLEEWRDRTLEQVHFAAKAALNAVVVQGNLSIRQYVAAMATGDLNQCLAQGPNIDAVRRMAQGMAGRSTAAPGFATTLDPKGALSLNNLAEAMQRLGVENALCHMLQPHRVLQPHEVDLFFNQTFSFLVQDRYITDITED